MYNLYNFIKYILDDSEVCIKLRKYMEIHVCKKCKWRCVFKDGSGSFKFLIGCFIKSHSLEMAEKIIEKALDKKG